MSHWLSTLVLLIGCLQQEEAAPAGKADHVEDVDSGGGDAAEGLALMPGVNALTIEQVVDGDVVERSYLVHLPEDYDGTGNTPLLFAFHGNGGHGERFVELFAPSVESGEFVGVYPNGIANSWNIGREESTADDVAFTASILAVLEGGDGIDAHRPVAVGFSNGAALVHKIGIESDLFVAIVPQVSQLLEENQPQADGARLSVMQFNGTEDELCPYEGGKGVMGHVFMSAEDSAATWAAHNGCDSVATEVAVGEHIKMEWEHCEEGRRVIHYKLNGVGHEVPPDVDGGSYGRIIAFLREARE